MRIAVLSDIHGNRTAFEAVLADLRRISPDLVFHAGDLADAGSGPVEIVDQMRALGWKGVTGNTDQMLASPETFESFASRSTKLASLWNAIREMAAFTRELLGEERLLWLRSLPLTHFHDHIAIVHASPGDTWSAPSAQSSDEEFGSRYASLGRPVVLYGHIHQPFVRKIEGFTIANPGSIGQPLDGDPRASYLVMDTSPIEVNFEVRRVEYRIDREVEALRASWIPYAEWIVSMLESAKPQLP